MIRIAAPARARTLPILSLVGALASILACAGLTHGADRWMRATLLIGIWIIVPLARAGDPRGFPSLAFCLAAACGSGAVLSNGAGLIPGFLATVWIAFTLLRWHQALRHPTVPMLRLFADTLLVGAAIFLAVRGFWGRVYPFDEIIITLTSIHFTYAGYGAFHLMAHWDLALSALTDHRRRHRRLMNAALILFPLVAIGISASRHIETVAGVALSLSFALVALNQLHALSAMEASRARRLGLAASSLSLLAAMILSGAYAATRALPADLVTIPTMLRSHGPLNAFGFVALGLVVFAYGRGSNPVEPAVEAMPNR